MAMVGIGGSSLLTAQVSWLGLRVGDHLAIESASVT